MKKNFYSSSIFFLLISVFCLIYSPVTAQNARQTRQLFQLKIYHLDSPDQESNLDHFLDNAYLPALHRAEIEPAGVFKPLDQDTTSDRRIYVLIPFNTFEQFKSLPEILRGDAKYQKAGEEYIRASADNPPYSYIESILLQAFPYTPKIEIPDLNSAKSERVYELRSYASASEKLNINKVEMFNEGGEIEIFTRLGFNAVFYGNVLSGSNMPDLMYMTSFENMESRNDRWEAFRNDAKWDELSSMDKYKGNVSRIEIQFLRPTDYSDL